MNDIALFEPQMPAKNKRELDARLSSIHQLAVSTKAAVEAQASVCGHGWFTFISEANQAAFSLQAYQLNHPDENAEIAYQEWLADLEAKFNRLYSVLGDKLIEIIQGIPTESRPVGFLEELTNQLFILIFGDSPSTDPVLDQIHQLEKQAKSALKNTVNKHANSLPEYFQRAQMKNVGYENEP